MGNVSRDKKHVFIIRDLESSGSLRDHIHRSSLASAYGEKYGRPGKPLQMGLIRKYGRQILEAMRYLRRCGVVHYHLHSGNVIVQNECAKLSEIENGFLGYQLRHPLHQHLQSVKKVYPTLDVELCLFGYVLFEMASGMESPTPSPLDSLHDIPQRVDRNVERIIGRLFGDRSMGGAPTIDDLMADPFFKATNVPRGDVSLFTALKEENETVQMMRDAVNTQCF